MAQKIYAKVIALGEVKSGTSARTGNQWQNLDFVIEELGTSNKYVLRTFSTNYIDKLKKGLIQEFEFHGEADEYQGKWYNHLTLDRMTTPNFGYEEKTVTIPSAPVPTPTPSEAPKATETGGSTGEKAKADDKGSEGESGDLPF